MFNARLLQGTKALAKDTQALVKEIREETAVPVGNLGELLYNHVASEVNICVHKIGRAHV